MIVGLMLPDCTVVKIEILVNHVVFGQVIRRETIV